MKIATAIAAHDLELTVDGLNDIGGGERFAHGFGKFDESEILNTFFAQFGDPSGIRLGEAIAEFIELAVGNFDIPRGFDGAPTLLKFGGIGLGEMSFGVALHVNGAKLNVGIGEEAMTDGSEAGEIILNEDHDAAKATLDQSTQDRLPIL